MQSTNRVGDSDVDMFVVHKFPEQIYRYCVIFTQIVNRGVSDLSNTSNNVSVVASERILIEASISYIVLDVEISLVLQQLGDHELCYSTVLADVMSWSGMKLHEVRVVHFLATMSEVVSEKQLDSNFTHVVLDVQVCLGRQQETQHIVRQTAVLR